MARLTHALASHQQRWAYLVLVRIDPYIARRQWRGLPD